MGIEKVWGEYRAKAVRAANAREQFEEYRKKQTIALRNRLAILNDGLACKEAHRQANCCDVPYEDLVQYGRIGLLKAIERYDPAEGSAFSSFAVPYIRGEIQHFLRDHAWDLGKVPRRAIETASQVKRLKRRAIAAGRLDVDEQQVARSVGISGAKWQQVAEVTARKPVIDLDEVVHVAAEHDEAKALHGEVRAAVAKLPNPYRAAIVDHYFKGLSKGAIAEQSHVDVAQVQRWLAEGLRRLQAGHLGIGRLG